jgi:putative endonuclease
MEQGTYCAYIVASRSHILYTGMTSHLEQRVFDHKNKTYMGFTSIYNCNRLVWYQTYTTPDAAKDREKEINGWTRSKKVALIKSQNPTWNDLSEAWELGPIRSTVR